MPTLEDLNEGELRALHALVKTKRDEVLDLVQPLGFEIRDLVSQRMQFEIERVFGQKKLNSPTP